jgi:hypothetical protein
MKILLQIVILQVLTSISHTCLCDRDKNHRKETGENFKKSDIVFIGDVSSSDMNSKNYKIRVLETFKGDIEPGQTFLTWNTYQPCVSPVTSSGKWILYGRLEKDTFMTHECSLTRPFADPIIHPLPPPPFPHVENFDSTKAAVEYELELQKFEQEQKELLSKELLILKELRNKKPVHNNK